jgi:hypothetical protein
MTRREREPTPVPKCAGKWTTVRAGDLRAVLRDLSVILPCDAVESIPRRCYVAGVDGQCRALRCPIRDNRPAAGRTDEETPDAGAAA